jgi:hypothetical protein
VGLLIFGSVAVGAMLVTYALEERSPWFVLAFAAACAASATYGVMIEAWPFAAIEAVWSGVALHRWWRSAGHCKDEEAEQPQRPLPEDWGIQPVPRSDASCARSTCGPLGDLAVSLLVMVAGSPRARPRHKGSATRFVGTLLGTVLLSLAGIVATDTGVPTMVALRAVRLRGSYTTGSISCSWWVGQRSRSSSWRRPRKH